jgi:hypothetical protein
MASTVGITPGNAIRVTLLVAVTAIVLRAFANATGVGTGLTRFIP